MRFSNGNFFFSFSRLLVLSLICCCCGKAISTTQNGRLTHLVWIVNLMKKKETTKTENRMNKTLILLLLFCLLNILRSFKFHQILWMFVSLRVWFAELFFFASPLHSIHHLNMTMKSIWMNLRRIQSIPNKKESWDSVCCLCFWLAMRWEQKVPQLKWCKFAQADNHEKCCTNA